VKLTNLDEYRDRVVRDLYTIRLSAEEREVLMKMLTERVAGLQKEYAHYFKRDAQKHPERSTSQRFAERIKLLEGIIAKLK
jgi:hypothetical protein